MSLVNYTLKTFMMETIEDPDRPDGELVELVERLPEEALLARVVRTIHPHKGTSSFFSFQQPAKKIPQEKEDVRMDPFITLAAWLPIAGVVLALLMEPDNDLEAPGA